MDVACLATDFTDSADVRGIFRNKLVVPDSPMHRIRIIITVINKNIHVCDEPDGVNQTGVSGRPPTIKTTLRFGSTGCLPVDESGKR